MGGPVGQISASETDTHMVIEMEIIESELEELEETVNSAPEVPDVKNDSPKEDVESQEEDGMTREVESPQKSVESQEEDGMTREVESPQKSVESQEEDGTTQTTQSNTHEKDLRRYHRRNWTRMVREAGFKVKTISNEDTRKILVQLSKIYTPEQMEKYFNYEVKRTNFFEK